MDSPVPGMDDARAMKGRGRAGELGETIAGRFVLERALGEGGMAEVYAARDKQNGNIVALKLLKPTDEPAEAAARLRREAAVLEQVQVPAVVRIETYGQTADGRLFIAMELLEGETLGQRMRRSKRLSPGELAPIVAGVAAGLGAAHEQGIVHRDLKPDNVFLCQGNPKAPVQVKLLDFGISKVYGVQERLTRTGQVLGTPRYMAPEQLCAEPDLDAQVDLYALGVMLYEALSGTPPFVATSPSELVVAILHGKTTPLRSLCPELSVELEAVVMRAMARAPEARFATVHELAEAFLAQVERPRQRRGSNATYMMAGGTEAPTVAPADEGAEDPELRPGTFSSLKRRTASTRAAGSIDPAPEQQTQNARPRAMVQAPDAGPDFTPPPQPKRSRKKKKKKSSRIPLIIAAFAVAALSAVAVAAGLSVMFAPEAEPAAASEEAPGPEDVGVPLVDAVAAPVEAPSAAEPAAAQAEPVAEGAVAGLPGGVVVPPEESAPARRRSSASGSSGAASSGSARRRRRPRGRPVPPPYVSSPNNTLFGNGNRAPAMISGRADEVLDPWGP